MAELRFVREDEIDAIPRGDGGQLKHLAAPWTIGTDSLWLGVLELAPGGSTHANAVAVEGLHYTLSGLGREIIDGETLETRAGTCIRIPHGAMHQVINIGDEPLRVLSVTTPPIPRPEERP